MTTQNARLNVGNLDRLLRVVVGVVLLSLTVLGPRTAWGLIGILPLLTGLVGFCPLYRVLGMNTCPRTSAGATSSQR
jgi:hypothetical protein